MYVNCMCEGGSERDQHIGTEAGRCCQEAIKCLLTVDSRLYRQISGHIHTALDNVLLANLERKTAVLARCFQTLLCMSLMLTVLSSAY